MVDEAGSNLERAGRLLGKSAARISKAARASAPRAGELARQSRQNAQPYLAQAVRFLRDHEDELKQAGATGARVVAARSAPPLLQPVVGAVVNELTRRPPVPLRDPNVRASSPDEPPAGELPAEDPPRNFF